MAIEIVDFPIKSMVTFHGKMLVHQMVWYICHELSLVYQKLLGFESLKPTYKPW